MENREQQILSEIKSMMASIRSQLERLDAKMAELQQVVDPDGFESVPVDIDIDVEGIVEAPVAEPVELAVDDDLPFDDESPEAEAEAEPAVEIEEVHVSVPAVEEDDDDLPGVFDVPEPVTVASKAADAARPTINDMMAEEHAWRRDMPGTPVRDIRSAISLNDRVIFINLLFNEDAQMFVNALTSINSMETLDQVVDFVRTEFPAWDLNSEVVYRFMMAVRRKVK